MLRVGDPWTNRHFLCVGLLCLVTLWLFVKHDQASCGRHDGAHLLSALSWGSKAKGAVEEGDDETSRKVAILVSGMVRSFPGTVRSWKQQLLYAGDISFDLFLHAHTKHPVKQTEGKLKAMLVKNGLSRSVKGLVVEALPPYASYDGLETQTQQKSTMFKGLTTNTSYVLNAWQSLREANDLRLLHQSRRGRQYDLVVWLRFDQWLWSDLGLEIKRILAMMPPAGSSEEGFLYLPDCQRWKGGYNDQMAAGSPSVMDKYANKSDFIRATLDRGFGFHPEYTLKLTLDEQNIRVRPLKACYGVVAVTDVNKEKETPLFEAIWKFDYGQACCTRNSSCAMPIGRRGPCLPAEWIAANTLVKPNEWLE